MEFRAAKGAVREGAAPSPWRCGGAGLGAGAPAWRGETGLAAAPQVPPHLRSRADQRGDTVNPSIRAPVSVRGR